MKRDVYICMFPSNSLGEQLTRTEPVHYAYKVMEACRKDPRIDQIHIDEICTTPVTMSRNRAVKHARQKGADLCLMIDSDMKPDVMLGRDPQAKPFWETSLNWLLDHPGPNMIYAPYCGPPTIENVYCFQFTNWSMETQPTTHMRLEQFSREQAAIMGGITETAAGPTGLILFDMGVFDLVAPPYFHYEYTDEYETDLASTEDVVLTRNAYLLGAKCYCNWDAWAGHWKPKCVEKPEMPTQQMLSSNLKEAFKRGHERNDRLFTIENGRPQQGSSDRLHESYNGRNGQGRIAALGLGELPTAVNR